MNASALAVCRQDLYLSREELMARYPLQTVEKVVRVRDMHQMIIADPMKAPREVVGEIVRTYGVSEATAYSDLRAVQAIIPAMTEAKRSFHRWKTNEMLAQAWEKAKEKGDPKAMEKIAATYAKVNRVDLDDEQETPLEAIKVQPFVPTMDPRVLGIEPIPNLQDKINGLIAKYTRETIDIEDITYEEADLQEDDLFPDCADGRQAEAPD